MKLESHACIVAGLVGFRNVPEFEGINLIIGIPGLASTSDPIYKISAIWIKISVGYNRNLDPAH